MSPLITIIVPVYKINELLLRKSINSLLEQTLKDIEIIFIDDGSPDNCGLICNEYGRNDKRIKVIQTKNEGVSNARNRGITLASGKYIMFVDGDDTIKNDTCEKCYEVIEKTNAEIILYRAFAGSMSKEIDIINIERDEIEAFQIRIINQNDNLNGVILGSPWGKIFRTEFLKKNNLNFVSSLKKSQDRVFMLYCLEMCSKIYIYNFRGYNYTSDNSESVCNAYNSEIDEILDFASSEIEKFVIKHHKDDKRYLDALIQMKLKFFYITLQLKYFNRLYNNSIYKVISDFKCKISSRNMQRALEDIDYSLYFPKAKIFFFLVRKKCIWLSYLWFVLVDFLLKLKMKWSVNLS